MVDANELVVGAGRQVSTIGGKADGMDGSQVVAHVAKLSRFGIGLVVCIVDRLGRPDTNVAI